MTEQDKIIAKIKEVAYENVNKKLEEERKRTEEKINNELTDVETCLAYIKNKLVYKETKSGHGVVGYELADEDMFFRDYTKDEKNRWHYGIQFFAEDKRDYNPLFKVNGENYYDTRNLLRHYERNFREYNERLQRLNRDFTEIAEQANRLKQQEKHIKDLLEQYKQIEIDETKIIIEDDYDEKW